MKIVLDKTKLIFLYNQLFKTVLDFKIFFNKIEKVPIKGELNV